jgi:hypothetical protein
MALSALVPAAGYSRGSRNSPGGTSSAQRAKPASFAERFLRQPNSHAKEAGPRRSVARREGVLERAPLVELLIAWIPDITDLRSLHH